MHEVARIREQIRTREHLQLPSRWSEGMYLLFCTVVYRGLILFLDGQYFLIFVLDGEKLQISFSSHACVAADALPR
jgi:hypothetical protein